MQRVQIPEVETTRVDATCEFPLGKTLLIGGLKTRNSDGQLQSMLVPYAGLMDAHPVSRHVNSPKHDDPDCLA